MPHKYSRGSILTALLVPLLLFSDVLAIEKRVDSAKETDTSTCEKCRCFRGRPGSQCRLYWITEVGLLTVVDSRDTRWNVNGRELLTFDIGYMFNISRRDAIGGSLFIKMDTEGDDSYSGFKPRYRRWLSDDVGLDVGFGVGRWEYDTNKKATPLVAQLGLSYKDYFSLTVLIDRVKWTESIWVPGSIEYVDGASHTSTTTSIGLTAGSYPALITTGVGLVLALMVIGPDTIVAD